MKKGDVLVSRYKVIKKIGQGGMQEVYSADDLIIGNIVAIKTPLQGETKRRFKQSAILAAKVNNHGIARTLDYFVDDDTPYLVEEFVEGDTLDEAILNFSGYIDPYLAVRLFGVLAKGIAASHHVGVVHRDLKPSNTMVTGGFALTAVKITDFGIATLAKEVMDYEIDENEDITKSTSGTVKGAIPFMAPEMMFRKEGSVIDSPADIWSLGALMFFALTGKKPFGVGLNAVAAISKGERKPWPPFLLTDPQFKPLAQKLKAIVESCLQTDSSLRPTADDIVREISSLCSFSSNRYSGTVQNMPSVYFGFISSALAGKTMFHRDSVYGPNIAKVNSKVVFAKSIGNPHFRAFPVLVEK